LSEILALRSLKQLQKLTYYIISDMNMTTSILF